MKSLIMQCIGTELHKLAYYNDIDQENIELYFKDINAVSIGKFGSYTPLHIALIHSNRKAALFLIAFGADVNIKLTIRGTGGYWCEEKSISFVSTFRKEFRSIILLGADEAKYILFAEGHLDGTLLFEYINHCAIIKLENQELEEEKKGEMEVETLLSSFLREIDDREYILKDVISFLIPTYLQ